MTLLLLLALIAAAIFGIAGFVFVLFMGFGVWAMYVYAFQSYAR